MLPARDGSDQPVDRNTVPDEAEMVAGVQKAIQKAIADLHRQGIPTVHRIDGQSITVMPDGSRHPTPPLPSSDA
jgi:hypothetical protein